MLKGLKYLAIAFAAFCTLIVVYGVGKGMISGWEKRQSFEAVASGMPRETWLARLRPMEVAGQCANSPIQRSLKGDYQSCVLVVEPLFQFCASGQEFHIPPSIKSRAEAEALGALIGECMTAHHFGDEHLKIFRRSLAPTAET